MAEDEIVEVRIEVGGADLRVLSAEIVEGVSALGGATVLCDVDDDLDGEQLLDQLATVSILDTGEEKRRFTLRVAAVRFVPDAEMRNRYELELHPAFWFLRFGRDVRKWRDLPTEGIVSMVLGEQGVAHTWATTRPSALRPWTVQYRESHLAFVSRLLEYEGVYFTFDDDGTMRLADRSSASAPVAGYAQVRVLDGEGALAHDDRGITTLSSGRRVGSGKATVNDYDWKRPASSLLQSSTGARDADLEVYDYPTGYRDGAIGILLAQLRREALECGKEYARGTSTVPTFAAGRIFEVVQEGGMSFGGSWFLTSVTHRYTKDTNGREGARYENRFEAIPAGTPFRPALATPHPQIAGNHTAMVRGPSGEEIHTDVFGRAKVQFHWDREATGTDADSRWVRVLQETSTSMALARVGWEVLVGYIDGDPDRPVAVARNINGEMVPTYAQPAQKNVMTIKTETYPGKGGFNELKLDDSGGAMRIDVRAERDLGINVQHDKTERIGNDETHVVGGDLFHRVEKTQTVAIGAKETMRVAQKSVVAVGMDRTVVVGGSEKVNIATGFSKGVSGADRETVGSVRRTISGSFSIPIPKPQDFVKGLVPSAGKVAGAVGGAVLGPKLGGAAAAIADGKSPGAALGDVAKSAGKTLASQAASAVMGKGGGAGGGGASSIGAAVGNAFALPSGAPDVGAALKGLVPSPSSMLSQATGGLSDVRSISDLSKFFKGTIARNATKRVVRSVGGAYVVLAGGNVTHDATRLLAETVGGVKLSIAAKDNIRQTVTGQMVRAVGGMVKWKAKGDVNVASHKSAVTVGGSATFDAGDKLELRGGTIEIEGSASVKLTCGDLTIELTPDGATLAGNLNLDSPDSIKVSGGTDDLTG